MTAVTAVTARAPSALLGDPLLRAEQEDVDLLSGDRAGDLLRAVLDAEGVSLVRWSTHRVHHRPGAGVTVGWTVVWRAGAVEREDYLLGTTARVTATPGTSTVLAGDRTVRVWRHPEDPVLPGLALACHASALGRLLGSRVVGLELVTYRPLRRAVLRVTTDGGAGPRVQYLKVVRPHTAEAVHGRHVMLREAGLPAARCRPVADGVLLLDELAGRPLTEAFAADGAVGIDPMLVTDLLDRLPDAAVELPRRAPWAERVGHHAQAAATAHPARAAEILALGAEIDAAVRASDPGRVVPTHGDLHEANLLLQGGRVTGLVDVDSLGPGHRVDDVACLLAHMSVLPGLAPEVHRHVPAALPRWTDALARGVDPVALHARAAAVTLSLVAGARTDAPGWTADADARVAAARTWLTGAVVPERPLIAGSSSSHTARRGSEASAEAGQAPAGTRREP